MSSICRSALNIIEIIHFDLGGLVHDSRDCDKCDSDEPFA